MRVAVIAELVSGNFGGAHTYQRSVLEQLARSSSRHEFIVFNTSTKPASDSEWITGLKRIDLGNALAEEAPDASRSIFKKIVEIVRAGARRALRKSAPLPPSDRARMRHLLLDALHAHDIELVFQPDPWLEPLPLPYFVTVWDLAHRQTPYFPEVSVAGWKWDSREAHYRAVLPQAAKIFSGTQLGKEQIVRAYGVNPDNVVVNPFMAPVPDPVLVQAAQRREHGLFFYPAQFWPHKNHANLLHALYLLKHRYGLAPKLVLTGSDAGNLSYVESLIAQYSLADQVQVEGFVPAARVAELYKVATALVFPTLVGPDNLPPLEAFSYGCPVLASDIPGAREQLGDAVLYFDPLSAEQIATKMSEILSENSLAQRLQLAGSEVVRLRTAEAHVATILDQFDRFEPIRATWGMRFCHR